MKKRLLYGYLILVLASHLVWWLRDTSPPPREGGVVVQLVRVADGRRVAGTVSMTYRDYPADRPDAPVLVLIHGSPGGLQDFGELAAGLVGHCRVIVPDLPGFGASRQPLPDYSFEAHSHYLEQLLDLLELDRVHLVPFSMGGGVALHLATRQPERIASIALVATLGVQELELFGQYELNHAVHGFQLVAIRAMQWLLPHFGALEGFGLNVPYARNFYDSDQRPLRAQLKAWEGPMLVVHGEHDFLVPVEAAREHARLVPQSKLVEYDGSHFLIWTRPLWLAEQLRAFISEVEAGSATTRAGAESARIAAAQREWQPADAPPMRGGGLIVAMLLLAMATLVSEDLTCIATGLLVAQGRLPFVAGSLACILGIFIGDLMLFLFGRAFGRRALRYAPLRWWISPAAVDRASAWFQQRGARVIFISRFMPGLRLATYVSAGVLRIRLRSFVLWFLLAAGVWTPLLVGVSALLGRQVLDSVRAFEDFALPALVALIAAMWMVQKLLVPLASHRGRRLLLGAWKRRTRWEYWPALVFYLPLLPYFVWLALRHRGLRTATAVNPGISSGGLVGESKSSILAAMPADSPWLPAMTLLPATASAAQRTQQAERFLNSLEQPWPLVVKPDVGERGRGVEIVRDAAQLEARLRRDPTELMVQQYVDGLEYGAFYRRDPAADRGQVFSLTEKRMPHLVGDGQRTLERLILDDPRAVCQAQRHFDHHRHRLLQVPAAGEVLALVEIGTHARGCLFLDANAQITPGLEDAVEEIARSLPGFHFGRIDLRVPSVQHLHQGLAFQVLEINGLTSEAAHIYDPQHGVFYAWRVIARQWRTAFQIGAANRRAGARIPAWSELWRAWRRSRRRTPTPVPSISDETTPTSAG